MAEPGRAGIERRPWGVAALLVAVADTLAARLGAVTVTGELSGFQRAASGHCYFTLKDADGAAASLRCVMFRRAAGLLDFSPTDGQQVELRGRLAIYEARGDLQLVAEAMRPAGQGNLYEQFLRLKARLQAEGLFDAERKRALPRFARRIGVVTSLQAAALQDVLSTLARRAPQVEVIVYPTPVQGVDAPAAIVRALAIANARAEVDLLVLARGGGSLEDLWPFNDERVVRAVAASALPLVCGVGHETDITLVDFAADLRAPTPTAAAELAAPSQVEALAQLQALSARAERPLRRRLDGDAQRLDRAALALARPAQGLMRQRQRLEQLARRWSRPQQRLADERLRLERLTRRLRDAAQHHLERQRRGNDQLQARAVAAHAQRMQAARSRLATLDAGLKALAPQRVLQRGYAWIADADGRPVLSVRQLQPGAAMRARWHDGHADASVTRVQPDAETQPGETPT